MRPYEVVYVLDASLDQDAVAEKLGGFHAVLGDEAAGVDHWGVRRLAYPIGKARLAYYAVAQVTAAPAALPEFERQVKLDEQVLRHLIVLDEGQPASGESIFAELPPTAEDEAAKQSDGDDPAADAAAAEGPPGDGANAAPDGPAAGLDMAGPPQDADSGASMAEAEAERRSVAGEGPEAAGAETDEAAAAEHAGPVAGPPEFSGARGRSRRHDAPRILMLNYKDVATLSHFINEQGKILPKRTTKVTARFQRQLGTAVKRARYLALLPYVRDHEA